MISCLNRRRGKRTIPTPDRGGVPYCRGHLVVVLTVPVIVTLKSWRDERPETMLPARLLRSGVRVRPELVVAALRSSSTHDVRCSTCAYSRNSAKAALRLRGRSS